MASEHTMTIQAAIMQEDEYDDGDDDGFPYLPHHPHNLSRLSMCTSNSILDNDDDDDDDDDDEYGMSHLSIESLDGFADEEFSDDFKEEDKEALGLSSDDDGEDDDKEAGRCHSLPATPPRRRNRGASVNQLVVRMGMEYGSENEAHKGIITRKTRNKKTRKRVIRERWLGNSKMDEDDLGGESTAGVGNCNNSSFSGESEGGSGGGGVVVITRPKGGRRSLCMDLEEVKACRDLGFELEHERMLEMPSRISLSASTLETSSGGNSPIASWRISSPGDDPRDVKARLKVWAQAVALASTSAAN